MQLASIHFDREKKNSLTDETYKSSSPYNEIKKLPPEDDLKNDNTCRITQMINQVVLFLVIKILQSRDL